MAKDSAQVDAVDATPEKSEVRVADRPVTLVLDDNLLSFGSLARPTYCGRFKYVVVGPLPAQWVLVVTRHVPPIVLMHQACSKIIKNLKMLESHMRFIECVSSNSLVSCSCL